MQEEVSWVYGVERKNLSFGITVRHQSASLVMPISDPRDRFFYPHHTSMKDSCYFPVQAENHGITITHTTNGATGSLAYILTMTLINGPIFIFEDLYFIFDQRFIQFYRFEVMKGIQKQIKTKSATK